MSKKTVALALSSGGARGLTQIGAIEVLLDNGFEINAIAGTSIGSLIGGLYASGHLKEFSDWIVNLDKSDVFDLVDFTLNSQGFVKGDRVFNEMKKFIPLQNIEDLSIPFVAVSADLTSRTEVQISKGDLFDAIRASIAVPSVLTPVEKGEMLLVDGGVVNPLPITAIPKSNAELTIAINLNGPGKYTPVVNSQTKKQMEQKMWSSFVQDRFSLSFKNRLVSSSKKKKRPNYFEIVNNSFDLMQDKLTNVILENQHTDILVNIPRECATTFEFFKGIELIEYGKEAMKRSLENYNNSNN